MARKPRIKPDPDAMRRGPDPEVRDHRHGGGLRPAETPEGVEERPRGNDVQPPRQKPS